MAYTKTNLNETTKTVAEQAARAYSKTVWNESTPITADKLNKIENGIASALPLTGGTLSGHLVLENNIAIGGKDTSGTSKLLTWVDRANNAQFGDTTIKSVINSSVNPEVNVGGTIHQLIHTGSLTQKMTFGKYSSKNWADAQIEINAGTSAGGVARLNFHRESHSQMSIIHKEKDKLHVEYDNGTQQRILTEGDSCSRLSWNGSRISIDNGGNNAAVNFADVSEIARNLHNHHTGQNFKLRAAAGLAPADGWLTMTW